MKFANIRILIGFALAFGIGVLCRLAGVPLPAPPVLIGALLVVAMSAGYAITDRFAGQREAANRKHCGGPTGERAGEKKWGHPHLLQSCPKTQIKVVDVPAFSLPLFHSAARALTFSP